MTKSLLFVLEALRAVPFKSLLVVCLLAGMGMSLYADCLACNKFCGAGENWQATRCTYDCQGQMCRAINCGASCAPGHKGDIIKCTGPDGVSLDYYTDLCIYYVYFCPCDI